MEALSLIAIAAGLAVVAFLYYTNRLRWYAALPAIVALLVLSMVAQAQAQQRVRWGMYDGQCYYYRVTEYRTGVLQQPLWKLNQRIDWCQTTPGGRIWSGPTVRRAHWEGPTWTWAGVDLATITHYRQPSRWVVRVKAAFDGLTPVMLIEHNYPSITMTIYKANPTDVHYTARCGC